MKVVRAAPQSFDATAHIKPGMRIPPRDGEVGLGCIEMIVNALLNLLIGAPTGRRRRPVLANGLAVGGSALDSTMSSDGP